MQAEMANDERQELPVDPARGDISPSPAIDAFLQGAGAPFPTEGARLIFALDATMSRQPTWDFACSVQAEMFDAVAALGGMQVQLVYFRGFGECRASRWVADPTAFAGLMARVGCRAGQTQIGRVLAHVEAEAGRSALRAFIYVGDAAEEPIDTLAETAGRLGLVGVKAFMFHEGSDPTAHRAFTEIARLTGGAALRFDRAAPGSLAGLLRAVAAYAGGGASALARLAGSEASARRLIEAMRQ
jgi:hypothetical protein